MAERKLQFVEGTSSKFWHARVDDRVLTVVFGRIGTNGQTQEKTLGSADEATKAFDKLVAEKLKKGYVDEDGAAAPASANPSASAQSKPRPKKPKAEQPTPSADSVTDAEPPAEETSGATPHAPRQNVASRPEVRIRISAADRARALVDGIPAPQPRPPVAPYDHAACIARIRGLGDPDAYTWNLPLDRLGLTMAVSRDEALQCFWVVRNEANWKLGALADALEKGERKIPEFDAKVLHSRARALALLTYRAFGRDELIRLLAEDGHWIAESRFDGFETLVVPFLDDDERRSFRDQIHRELGKSPGNRALVRVLAQLGEDAAWIRAQVQSWPDGSGARAIYDQVDSANHMLRTLFALRDPDEIAREAIRLGANPVSALEVRLLLAATGTRALGLITDTIVASTTRSMAEALAKALALVESPEAAVAMLRVMLESKAASVGRAWLDDHPAFAADGLVALVGTAGPKGEAATTYVRSLQKLGLEAHVEAALALLPAPQAAAVRQRLAAVVDAEYPLVEDAELPEWALRCFGDPAKLTAPPVELPPEKLHPVVRVDVDASSTAAAPPALPPPQPVGEPALFDFEASLAQVLSRARTNGTGTYTYHSWDFGDLGLTLPLSRREAHFWLVSLKTARYDVDAAAFERQMRLEKIDGNPPPELLREFFAVPPSVAYTLSGFEGLARYVGDRHSPEPRVELAISQVVRFLTQAQRDALRAHLLDRAEPTLGSMLLARRLGATKDELAPYLSKIGNVGLWTSGAAIELLAVLEDPAAIVAAAEAMGVYPNDASRATRWLAITGTLGAARLGRTLSTQYVDKPAMLKVLARVASAEVAAPMIALRKSSATKEIARQWLEANPVFAIEGLLPLVGSADKQSADAIAYLRELRRRGYGPVIAARSLHDSRVEKLVLDPLADLAKPTPADRTLAALLPQLVIRCESGLRRLTAPQVATILAELRSSTLGAPTQRVSLMREHAERSSLDAFSWALFQGWLSDGAPTKERWKLEAVGHFGGDASALRLAALVRTWPGESQHQRAVVGLDCLREIGTDTALMQIHGIAQRVSFKAIKERAAECLDGIAQDRGMTRDELADRIIPDGGLDARGTRTFDFGPRSFQFYLGSDLKPMLRDATGKKLTDLPKPGAKDDAALAAESVAAWKLLKKQVADVAKTQAARLELAMVLARRWTPEEHELLFRKHPLMIHLVRRLIWAAYDAEGKMLGAFRVADDDTLADADDAECALPAATTHVGIAHPSQLSESERSLFGERLADYDIIPPFAQLGRPTLTITDAERPGSLIRRFGEHDVDAKVLVFGLEALGWQRGRPQDGGGFWSHRKTYGRFTAVVTYAEGCWAGTNGDDWPRQRIEALGFASDAGRAEDGFFSWATETSAAVPLADVDPLVLSEALYDVTRLYERGAPST